MRAITRIGLIIAGAGGLIIAAQGAWSETERPTDGHPLVVLPRSMSAGRGLQLASYGVAELTTDDGVAIAALHVRAVIDNTTRGLPWALDASRARVELASGPIAPAFVSSDVATLPIAILDPGEHRTIDFYFPLPPELRDGGPTRFLLTWTINAPTPVQRDAWFDRVTAVPRTGPAPAVGPDPRWWFDPRYPWPAYRHRAGIVTHRPPSHVVVTKAPRWEDLPDTDEPDPRLTECDQW